MRITYILRLGYVNMDVYPNAWESIWDPIVSIGGILQNLLLSRLVNSFRYVQSSEAELLLQYTLVIFYYTHYKTVFCLLFIQNMQENISLLATVIIIN